MALFFLGTTINASNYSYTTLLFDVTTLAPKRSHSMDSGVSRACKAELDGFRFNTPLDRVGVPPDSTHTPHSIMGGIDSNKKVSHFDFEPTFRTFP